MKLFARDGVGTNKIFRGGNFEVEIQDHLKIYLLSSSLQSHLRF